MSNSRWKIVLLRANNLKYLWISSDVNILPPRYRFKLTSLSYTIFELEGSGNFFQLIHDDPKIIEPVPVYLNLLP